MKTSDFDYYLPEELIAQTPLKERDSSRLLCLDKKTAAVMHKHFTDLQDMLCPSDMLVFNNSKVIPARLLGCSDYGAPVEILLLKQRSETIWETLVKPGKRCKVGATLIFGDGILKACVVETLDTGNRLIEFKYEGIFMEVLNALGKMPLPPYIKETLNEPERYQTIYAKHLGSAAAPTAGLHFSQEMLNSLKAKGIKTEFLTLHVGLGTFRPVKVDNLTEHVMHSESYSISPEVAYNINSHKAAGGRVIAVGTTSLRTLEAASSNGHLFAGEKETDIFIYPGYNFKTVDALITNFHLPQSTLLMLISALAGKDSIMNAYKNAVEEKYRFFSFGDAMFIS